MGSFENMDLSLIYFDACWWETFKNVLLIDLSEVMGLLFLHQNCSKAFAGIFLTWYVAVQWSVNKGFVVTWQVTVVAVRVAVNDFLNGWGCKRGIVASYCLGRKERGFFITLRGVLSFYRYSLWVFLTGLKAYLLEKAT